MPSIVGTLAVVVVALAAAIVVLLWLLMRRTRASRALGEREDRFRGIAEGAPVMIRSARPDTTLDYLNSTCVAFSGRSLQQLLDEGWLDSVHPEDVEHCLRTYGPAFEARTPFLMEWTDSDGPMAYTAGSWILASRGTSPTARFPDTSAAASTSLNAGRAKSGYARAGPRSRSAIGRFKHWAGCLIEAQDAERARIARDLHDDVSQQLAGVSIAFSGLKRRLGEYPISEDLQQELADLQTQAHALARYVCHLSHDLHPTRAPTSRPGQRPDVGTAVSSSARTA